MKIRDIMLLALLFGTALSRNSHADICYVDAGATGTRTGTSWVNAYQNREFALLQPTCSEFWIAKGVYKPTLGTNPSASFVINRDVKLYGGFAGRETSLDQRNPEVNLTVLSG